MQELIHMRKYIKNAAILFLLFAVLCAVIWFWPKSNAAEAPLEVVVLKVGKADALLMLTQNSTVVIDTGEDEDGEKIVSYLEERGRNEIDCLIITHFDKDHVGGADILMNRMPVKCVYQTNTDKDSRDYEEYLEAVGKNQIKTIVPQDIVSFTLDGVAYRIYPPGEQYSKKKSNNSSLIVDAVYGDSHFLFMGDAMDERLAEFMERYKPGEYDVVKMPYHGNYLENLPDFLDMIKPEYAVITASDKNKEDEHTVLELEKRNISAFITRYGTVSILCDGKKVQIAQ